MMNNVNENSTDKVPHLAKNAVLVHSSPLPADTPTVKGYDWNRGIDYHALLSSYKYSGFQARNFGLAVEEIQKMIAARNVPLEEDQLDTIEEDDFIRRKSGCTIFLGYTSNMASCGIRDTIRFLVEHKMVDCIVATAGGVEEDFIKCLAPTYIGDFHLDGRRLRDAGINRIGNLLVPNDNYCLFEDWVMPRLDAMLLEQKEKGTLWSPSKIIARLGEEINNKESIYYWAAKNKIPVFSPALTDGSLGDMLYFHSYRNPGLVVDIISDLRRLNTMATKAIKSGMIIAGGGLVKHHICNANLMRNGADYAVFINTSSEFDGSDSGARPDEAISWGKIRKDAKPVKVYADASLAFPLLVGETFARHYHSIKRESVEILAEPKSDTRSARTCSENARPGNKRKETKKAFHHLQVRKNPRGKPIRRICVLCYRKKREILERQEARKNVKKTTTYCPNCPKSPQMCLNCFNEFHST